MSGEIPWLFRAVCREGGAGGGRGQGGGARMGLDSRFRSPMQALFGWWFVRRGASYFYVLCSACGLFRPRFCRFIMVVFAFYLVFLFLFSFLMLPGI